MFKIIKEKKLNIEDEFRKVFGFDFNYYLEYKSSLRNIFGLGIGKLKQVSKLFGINNRRSWLLKDFDIIIIVFLKNIFLNSLNYFGFFGLNLRKKITIEIDKFLELNCFKKLRFKSGFPVRGQRTRSNAVTAKKLKRIKSSS